MTDEATMRDLNGLGERVNKAQAQIQHWRGALWVIGGILAAVQGLVVAGCVWAFGQLFDAAVQLKTLAARVEQLERAMERPAEKKPR